MKKAGCCGGYTNYKRSPLVPIPINPTIPSGIAMIYLGSGTLTLIGRSGEKYFMGDHQRHFKVYEEDVEKVLKNRAIILKP